MVPLILLDLDKRKHQTYAERRTFLSEQFTPLLDSLEFPLSRVLLLLPRSYSRTVLAPQLQLHLLLRRQLLPGTSEKYSSFTEEMISRELKSVGLSKASVLKRSYCMSKPTQA